MNNTDAMDDSLAVDAVDTVHAMDAMHATRAGSTGVTKSSWTMLAGMLSCLTVGTWR